MNFHQGPYLCIGADPHPEVLNQWELSDGPDGLRGFTKIFIDSLPESVRVIKPQISLFEKYGSKGFLILEEFLLSLKQMGKYVIADAKRSDIGSSMAGYTAAWLEQNSPFVADALTVSPYLGVDTFAEVIEIAEANQKRVFVLVATSNPEARKLQSSGLASSILDELSKYPSQALGVVVGATVDTEQYAIDQQLQQAEYPILAPGFGAQGINLGTASEIFPGISERVIANVSRSVLLGEKETLSTRFQNALEELG